MALTPLNQFASQNSQLSCFALVEGGECSTSYGSSAVSCVKCQKAESCIAGSRLKPNLLETVQDLSSQVERSSRAVALSSKVGWDAFCPALD